MLCLSRKIGEVILINRDIEVVVLDIRGGAVRLGIKAPPDVPVWRLEIAQKIEAEKAL